jgi:hypothetical protein
MFQKILIANRGDNRSAAPVAAKARVGAAGVRPQPDCRRARRAAIEPRS